MIKRPESFSFVQLPISLIPLWLSFKFTYSHCWLWTFRSLLYCPSTKNLCNNYHQPTNTRLFPIFILVSISLYKRHFWCFQRLLNEKIPSYQGIHFCIQTSPFFWSILPWVWEFCTNEAVCPKFSTLP
jgi:hypothetical protein